MNGVSSQRSDLHIGLIGDHDDQVLAHQCIPKALALGAVTLDCSVSTEWLPTDKLDLSQLNPARFQALWCVPASPYASMEGALAAITAARVNNIPFLGTCGGFQHALIEFARNVLSIPEADHQETSPDAPLPLIARMSCSLSNKTGIVHFLPGSRLREIVEVESRIEGYQCSYGLNRIYEPALEKCGLRFSARGADGSAHAFELSTHPFFFGSLFQPERAITREECHPLILAFIKAAGSAS